MPAIEKHRDEKEVYAISFDEKRLATGEVLTGTPTVTILKRSATAEGGYEDVSSEFGALGATLAASDTDVQFTLNIAASETVQLPGMYVVHIQCATDAGRNPVQPVDLTVSGKATVVVS
jgi:hypothetical protein